MDPNQPFYYHNMLTSPTSPSSSNSPQLPQLEVNPCNPQTHNFTQNPNDSFNPSVLYGSMYDDFSTQCSTVGAAAPTSMLAGNQSANALQSNTRGTKRAAWTMDDDKVLVSAYLNNSKDSIVGTDQSGACFWKKVTMYYNTYQTSGACREEKSCKNRWHLVNGQVAKFVGAYTNARARKKSGESENDVLLAAHKFYESDESKKFNLEHVWYMLKDDPKWMVAIEGSSSKRTKTNNRGYYSSSSPNTPSEPGTPQTPTTPNCDVNISPEESVPIRPIGVKAAKRKAKAKAPPMSSVHETEALAKNAEAEAHRLGVMTEFITSQNNVAHAVADNARAMADNARARNLQLYSKLAANTNLTEREEKVLALLDAELFPH